MPPALSGFGDQHWSAMPYLLVAPLIVAALLGLFFSRLAPGRQLLALAAILTRRNSPAFRAGAS